MADPDDLDLLDDCNNLMDQYWQARQFAEHMDACERAWRAGVAPAVADAIMWCGRYKRSRRRSG